MASSNPGSQNPLSLPSSSFLFLRLTIAPLNFALLSPRNSNFRGFLGLLLSRFPPNLPHVGPRQRFDPTAQAAEQGCSSRHSRRILRALRAPWDAPNRREVLAHLKSHTFTELKSALNLNNFTLNPKSPPWGTTGT